MMNIQKYKKHGQKGFTLIELLVVITIIGILASIALPVYSSIQVKGNQTKALSNAKQVGLSLKLYAGDNDGFFPRDGHKDEDGVDITVTTANDALRQLIPDYVDTESIFYVSGSEWTPTKPDENMTGITDRLDAGENHWAYVTNLRESSKSRLPLIADGFVDGSVGTYSIDETAKGGTWKGKRAIVIRVDLSGTLEKCKIASSSSTVEGPVGTASEGDIFEPSSTAGVWLSATQIPVNPL